MSSDTLFDYTVNVQASKEVVWEQIKRLLKSHGQITAQNFPHWIVASTLESSHVYYIAQTDSSRNQVSIRHLVIPDADVGKILEEAPDVTLVLDDFANKLPLAVNHTARYRLQLLVGAAEWQSTPRPAYEAVTEDLRLASLRARIAALFVDQYALNSVPAIIFLMFGVLLGHDFREILLRQSLAVQLLVLLPLSFVVTLLYHWYFLTRHNGQTPGKSLLGIRVVRSDRSPITFKTVFIRIIGYNLNSLFLFLGWLYALVDRDRRGWHDLLAGTIVVQAVPDPEAITYERAYTEAAPRVTWLLILINVLVFFTLGNTWGVNNHVLVWNEGQYFRLLTSMFLHINLLHLGFNMLALYFIGRVVEGALGSMRFALVYLLGGLLGSVASMLLNDIDIFSLGASGAVFAVFGAALVYYHRNRSLLGADDQTRKRNILYAVVILLLDGFVTVGIDNWAHLGGLVGGIIIALLIGPLLTKSRNPEDMDKVLITSNSNGPFRSLVAGTLLVAAIFGVQELSMDTVPRTFTGGGVTMEYPSNWAGFTDFEHTAYAEECNQLFPECLFRAAPHHNLYVEMHRFSGLAFRLAPVNELDIQFWHNLEREIPQVRTILREEMQLDGRDAIKRVYTFGDQTELMLFVKDQGTIVQFHALGKASDFERYRDELDAIVASLHFTEAS